MAKQKVAAIYARVSTNEQTVETQLLAVKRYCEIQGWHIAEIYQDCGISGASDERPALDKLKKDCAKDAFDVIVVYKFDRLARSTRHLLDCLELFRRYGVDFVSISEAVDTSTPVGKMVFTFLAGIAEFERSLIQERVRSGLERAKAEGIKLGRPRKGFDVSKALELRATGMSYSIIAKTLGIPSTTLFEYLKGIRKTPLTMEP